MGREHSFRSKAAHFVSDLTTVFLNPISDEPSKHPEDTMDPKGSEDESKAEEDSEPLVDGPDTSSFTAFLYSLLSASESEGHSHGDEQNGYHDEMGESASEDLPVKENNARKTLFSRGKHSLARVIYLATKFNGRKGDQKKKNDDMGSSNFIGLELNPVQNPKETVSRFCLPDISEPSLLLSEKMRSALYTSLPSLVQGRKWVLLYSTWRHGISLSTLYRRSSLCPGLSLLVVGDKKGAVFGGLVEAPLRPTSKRKYQGTKDTFIFTNISGHPVVFRPTGANHYFTLCSLDFLALGGGGHFALYLGDDLLRGSSSVSETYGNPCLAQSEDFEVKEVELWGFSYASKYEETIALCQSEAPGICRLMNLS
ncbi:TLD domain-containing protein 2 [Macadamia integrifolia]|uniref:TLD domain-containing protein 2 n=1 Tax=Macadamia integrifolia TaxID=60698 RepID=UPI001C4FFF22|nr:TLD domain-containing protein 2 [Macadamia integrifolia]